MTFLDNLSASIHQKLLNKATSEHRPFNELLQYYANERFLYRLGESVYKEQFVLKGAFVFLAWQAPLTRPTKDIDFLGFTQNSIGNLTEIVRNVCTQGVQPDGVIFDPDSVEGETINEADEYSGVRLKFLGYLGNARIHMQLDIGFADRVTTSPGQLDNPTVLGESIKPNLRVYPPETVVAEKFQTMVALSLVNSRMKDFFDLWYMAKTMKFKSGLLQKAIKSTFDQRGTPLPKQVPTALTKEFAAQKQFQWTAYIMKNQLGGVPQTFSDVIEDLRRFFEPIIFFDSKVVLQWNPIEGWQP